MENNELRHHGVRGMKWGIRRFQNKDGSLTNAGKKRYVDAPDKVKAKPETKKKRLSEMSDAELRERISRLEMEKRYKDLSQSSAGRETVGRGKKLVGDVLENSARNIGTQALTYAMGVGINALVKKMFKTDIDIVNPKKGQKDK